MQVSETLNEGLKREIQITVPAKNLAAKLEAKLEDTKGKVRLNGFRPGKVPAAHLRQMYGKSFMAEIIDEIVKDAPRSVLAERGERFAAQPEVGMTEDQQEADKLLAAQIDLVFTLKYEVLPEIELKDVSNVEVTREVVDVPETEIDSQVERVLSSTRTFIEKKSEAKDGDRVTIDYLGKVDGVAFDGGADKDAQLVIGSKQFIPGFEEQLIGVKAGDAPVLEIKFPEDYGASHLAGKEATFDIVVKEVAEAEPLKIDDETAKNVGVESLDKLRELVRQQVESQYGSFTRQKVKRQILDALDKDYAFDTPEQLVETEFNSIWAQFSSELEQNGRTFADEGTSEEEARDEYRKLAERRVRLGLVMSELGEKAGIQVSEEELQQAVIQQVRQYPGQEKEIMEFFRSTPDAVANLRAPIFEEKVVDHLLAKVKVTDKKVTAEELMKEDEENNTSDKKQPKKANAAAEKKTAAKKQTATKKDASIEDDGTKKTKKKANS